MAQILAGDIRKGTTFEYKSGVYTVTDFQHVKPGKGAAFVRTTLKNVVTGQVLSNETFNPTTKLETAQVETKKMTYSYYDGEFYLGVRHGYGKYFKNYDRSVYNGEWNNGLRHGYGTLTFPHENPYTGQTNKSGKWENDAFIG